MAAAVALLAVTPATWQCSAAIDRMHGIDRAPSVSRTRVVRLSDAPETGRAGSEPLGAGERETSLFALPNFEMLLSISERVRDAAVEVVAAVMGEDAPARGSDASPGQASDTVAEAVRAAAAVEASRTSEAEAARFAAAEAQVHAARLTKDQAAALAAAEAAWEAEAARRKSEEEAAAREAAEAAEARRRAAMEKVGERTRARAAAAARKAATARARAAEEAAARAATEVEDRAMAAAAAAEAAAAAATRVAADASRAAEAAGSAEALQAMRVADEAASRATAAAEAARATARSAARMAEEQTWRMMNQDRGRALAWDYSTRGLEAIYDDARRRGPRPRRAVGRGRGPYRRPQRPRVSEARRRDSAVAERDAGATGAATTRTSVVPRIDA